MHNLSTGEEIKEIQMKSHAWIRNKTKTKIYLIPLDIESNKITIYLNDFKCRTSIESK